MPTMKMYFMIFSILRLRYEFRNEEGKDEIKFASSLNDALKYRIKKRCDFSNRGAEIKVPS